MRTPISANPLVSLTVRIGLSLVRDRISGSISLLELEMNRIWQSVISSGVEMYRIFKNNLYVMGIAFILSLFYGSGALFLTTLNGSIFASALASAVKMKLQTVSPFLTYAFISCNVSIMFFHMIPEVASYLLAAIAGGVLSKAFIREKFLSKNFKKVLKDAFILLIAAFIVLVIAMLIEINISKKLFIANVCVNYSYLIILVSLLIIGAVVFFEVFRKIIKRHKF